MWGTPYGQPVTVSFWWKSSLTGTFCLTIKGGGYTYNASYTYSTAASWQYFTLTVPPPPNGATFFPNADSLFVGFAAYWVNNTSGVWVAGNSWGVTGGINFLVNNGAYIRLTGVQLEKGTLATPFEVRPYAVELQLCQRYYWAMPSGATVKMSPDSNTSTSRYYSSFFPVTMRASPTPTATVSTGGPGANYGTGPTTFGWAVTGVATGTSIDISLMTASAEL
jgi:hypothetical protein